MNVELLRNIAAVIEDKPAKLNMDYLHSDRDGNASSLDCGTAHCIAGWGEVLTGKDLGSGSFGKEIRCGVEAEHRLIFERLWPEPFLSRYQKAKQKRTKAKVAAARIEHFIATDGAE